MDLPKKSISIRPGNLNKVDMVYYSALNFHSSNNFEINLFRGITYNTYLDLGNFYFYSTKASYKGELFSGVAFNTHPNHLVKYQCDFCNGLKDGKYIEWHINGWPKILGEFKNNQRVYMSEYHENGTLCNTVYFKNDKPNGLLKKYNNLGNLIEEGRLIDGNKEGKWKSWFDNGALNQEFNFKNDKQ
ncbi:MAG: hypothetical protein ABJ092_14385 [Gillisia sp.]